MDLSSILLFGVLIIAVIAMMFFSNRRRRRDAETMEQKMRVGAEIMTGSGIYATIVELISDENDVVQKVKVETSPGHYLTLHRQAIARYIDDEPAVTEEPASETESEIEATEVDEPSDGVILNGEPVETETKPRRTRRKPADEA